MTLKNGNKLQFDALITTMPLDITLQWCGQKKWADGLTRRCGSLARKSSTCNSVSTCLPCLALLLCQPLLTPSASSCRLAPFTPSGTL